MPLLRFAPAFVRFLICGFEFCERRFELRAFCLSRFVLLILSTNLLFQIDERAVQLGEFRFSLNEAIGLPRRLTARDRACMMDDPTVKVTGSPTIERR